MPHLSTFIVTLIIGLGAGLLLARKAIKSINEAEEKRETKERERVKRLLEEAK